MSVYFNAMIALIFSVSLSACHSDALLKKAKKDVATIKLKKIQVIEPSPNLLPIKKEVYQAKQLRSPFKKQNKIIASNKLTIHKSDGQKNSLEKFPLHVLKMVGSIQQNNRLWALIETPEGIIVPVTIGQLLDQGRGKITNITEKKITVSETKGDRQTRIKHLSLNN